jgi:hypothetical protein
MADDEEKKEERVKVGVSPFGMRLNPETGSYEPTDKVKPKPVEPNQSKKDREDAAKAALENEKKEKDGS